MSKIATYFHGLNSLRAIAAFSVLIGHIELIKHQKGLPNLLNWDYFKYSSGHTGVVLFFVLSGFLITYLLLKEQHETSRISFREFYLKRLLRVWPLYFLIILLSVFIFQYSPNIITWVLCLTIFPNVASAMDLPWSVSPHLWSIGVEEQFYLVHPFLVRFLKKWLFLFLVVFYVGYIFLPQIIVCYMQPSASDESFLRNFFYGSKYNCMALGGIAAILQMNYGTRMITVFKNRILSSFLFVLPFIFWLFPFPIYLNDTIQICITKVEITQEVFALLFAIQILVVINNSTVSKLITFKILDYLGKISYGIYMFHWIIILLVIQFLTPLLKENYALGNLALYTLTLGLSILISALSFRYFESIFTRIRNKIVRH